MIMKMMMATMMVMKTMAKKLIGMMTKANTQMITRPLAPQYPELTLLQLLQLLWMKRILETRLTKQIYNK